MQEDEQPPPITRLDGIVAAIRTTPELSDGDKLILDSLVASRRILRGEADPGAAS
jgi:hypothetical protein